MSAQPEKSREGAFELLEEAMDEEEAERIGKLSVEELHAEMKERGLEPADGKRILERALAEQDGKVVALQTARARRAVPVRWLAVAAAAAVVLTGYLERETLVAWVDPPRAIPSAPPLVPAPTGSPGVPPEQIAAEIRAEGLDLCAKGLARSCLQSLDQAKALDPLGELDARVQKAREQAKKALESVPEDESKVPLGPNERPLQRHPPRQGSPAPSQ